MDKQLFLDMYFIVLSTYKIGKEVSSISAGIQKYHLKYEHDCKTPVIKTMQTLEIRNVRMYSFQIHFKTMSIGLSMGLSILSISKYLVHLR